MPPKSSSAYNAEGVEYHNIPEFHFSNGTTLHDVKVAFRSLNPASEHGVVLIPTCFSGWINTTLTFTDPLYDALSKYHVVIAAMLGNGESSSPSNKTSFPEPGQLRYEDVIRAHHHLVTEGLMAQQLEAVIGFSMGGQQAYHWAVMYPDFVKRIVGICTSARTTPHNYAFLEGPIAALERSVDYVAWKEAKTRQASGESIDPSLSQLTPARGLVGFKRAYAAWLTSAEWFTDKHWKSPEVGSVEAWIQSKSESGLEWDADDLLVLARMWQMGDIGKTANDMETSLGWTEESGRDDLWVQALSSIKCPVLLMPNRTDQYFRPSESEREMQHLKKGHLHVIESTWGHTSGGGACPEDTRFMNDRIQHFLSST